MERVFQPRWDALVQWLRVLKVVNPLYANFVIDETEPTSDVAPFLHLFFRPFLKYAALFRFPWPLTLLRRH